MSATIEKYKQQLLKYLYKENNKVTNLLAQAETKTKVKREYIVYGFISLFSLYLIFGYGAQLLCNVIGFIYPAFCSIKALESNSKEDDTRWLTYWVVFALFSVTEFFSDILLSWFPLYWLAKCVFLIWCFLPIALNGSDVIYARIVRPFFLKNKKGIDRAISKVNDKLDNIADDVTNYTSNMGTGDSTKND